MGATHKETVTELVKAMISSGVIKPKESTKDTERYILKKSIYLIEYGVRIMRDPRTQELIDNIITDENRKQENLQRETKVRVLNDLNKLEKQETIRLKTG